jgi:hypothetical protein
MTVPSVVIVASHKGGVGKTTVARTLIEYFGIRGFNVRALDTQSPHGELRRFHPAITEVLDITKTRHQIRLLDALSQPSDVTIVDLKAGALDMTLDFLREIGLFDASARGARNIVVLYLVTSSVSSLMDIEETTRHRRDCDFFFVKNNAVRSNGEGVEIVLPRLDPLAYENVELEGLPFSSFVLSNSQEQKTPTRSFVLRGYVQTWLEQVWDNFEQAGLDDLVEGGIQSSHDIAQRGRVA